MGEIVILERGEARTTTKELSDGAKIQHKNVMALVRKYQNDLCEFGLVAFETQLNTQGSATEIATLNEGQATLLMTYFKNTQIVRDFKKKLVKEFHRMKQVLLNQQNLSWQQERVNGKIARHSETDAVARFIDYASSQGSTSPRMYYVNITKMTNHALQLARQSTPPTLRDTLDAMQLNFLATAEYLIEMALDEGMKAGHHYKDVYLMARDKVLAFAQSLPIQRQISA